MSSVAILLTLWIVPYWQQAKFLAELREQNVYVYCEYDGPKQLSWCLRDRSIFVRPVQAQVLLQPDGDRSVKLLGKSVAIAEVHEKLAGLRDCVHARLVLNGFVLVTGFQKFPENVLSEINRQQFKAAKKSKAELFYMLTPCGISNFRYVRDLPPEAFGN